MNSFSSHQTARSIVVVWLAILGISELERRSHNLTYQIFETEWRPLTILHFMALAALPVVILTRYFMLEGRDTSEEVVAVIMWGGVAVYLIARYFDVKRKIDTQLIPVGQRLALSLGPTLGLKGSAVMLIPAIAIGMLVDMLPAVPEVIAYTVHILAALGVISLVHLICHRVIAIFNPAIRDI